MLCQVCFWVVFFPVNNVPWKEHPVKRGQGDFCRLRRRCHRCHRLAGAAESDGTGPADVFVLLLWSSLLPNALFSSRAQLAHALHSSVQPSTYAAA